MQTECNMLFQSPNAEAVIRQHFLDALRKSEEELLEIMEGEVMKTVHGNGPGKPDWRQDIQEKLEVVEETITDSFMEGKVGLDDDTIFIDVVRAMLIAYGGGSAGPTGQPIMAGPFGRMVWDDDLSGQKPSKVEEPDALPDAFNQPGNDFVQNSVTIMKDRFAKNLRQALSEQRMDRFVGVAAR